MLKKRFDISLLWNKSQTPGGLELRLGSQGGLLAYGLLLAVLQGSGWPGLRVARKAQVPRARSPGTC